jgi:hypothetical protein
MMQDNPAVARLKARFDPERPAIAMAAHNPLAAKLAAAAGFDAIWGSGFELSASYAVPDANILSVDTHLELSRAWKIREDLFSLNNAVGPSSAVRRPAGRSRARRGPLCNFQGLDPGPAGLSSR